MEEKTTIFHYLAQTMILFGFTMLTLNIFCFAFGESAKDFSSLFALGGQGIPINIAFQFLCICILVTGIRFLFFTDIAIKKMPFWLRTICCLSSIIAVIAVFILLFHWFPANMWQPWVMFFFCFGLSSLGSFLMVLLKERSENKRMENALLKIKQCTDPSNTEPYNQDQKEADS